VGSYDSTCLRTKNGLVSSTRGVACAIGDLQRTVWDLVSAPTIFSIRHAHDVLAFLQTDELTVARALELVSAMVLKWNACCEASDADHGSCSLCDGGRCDWILDSGGGRVVGGCGCEEHRGRREDGHESDEDHGDGDGGDVLVSCRGFEWV
jgi:hypothetical protein